MYPGFEQIQDPSQGLQILMEAMKKKQEQEETVKKFMAVQEQLANPQYQMPQAPQVQQAPDPVETHLMQYAKKSPQEIAAELKKQYWGKLGEPSKNPLSKVGKGLAKGLAYFGGAPSNFDDPARQFYLKIQELANKDNASQRTLQGKLGAEDIKAQTKLADVQAKLQGFAGRDRAAAGKLLLDFGKNAINAGSLELARDKFNALSKLQKEELALKTSRFTDSQLASEVARLKNLGQEDEAAMLMATYEEKAKIDALKSAASKGSGTSTSTREQFVPVVENGQQGYRKLEATNTRQGSVNQAAQDWLRGGRQSLANPYQSPEPPTPKPSTYTKAPAPPKSQTLKPLMGPEGGYRSVEVITPKSGSGFIPTGPRNLDDVAKNKEQNTFNYMVDDLLFNTMKGYINGSADKVHGASGNPASLAARGAEFIRGVTPRFLGGGNQTSASASDAVQTEWNSLTKRFENDKDAFNYIKTYSSLNTRALADYIKSISGKQVSETEAQRLSQLFPKISDSPQNILRNVLELRYRLAAINEMMKLGIPDDYIRMSMDGRNKVINKLMDDLTNRANKAKMSKLAGVSDSILTPEDSDIRLLVKQSLEQTGPSGLKVPGFTFVQPQQVGSKEKVGAMLGKLPTGNNRIDAILELMEEEKKKKNARR